MNLRVRLATRSTAHLLLAAICFGGCECDDQLSRVFGDLVVQPAEVDFGRVPVGSRKPFALTLENVGTSNLDLLGFEAMAPFSAEGPMTFLLASSSTSATVFFAPAAAGPVEGVLRIRTDDDDAPVLEVPLVGEGIEAAVTVEPSLVDFGEVLRVDGAMPSEAMVTVTNRGTDAFDLTEASLADDAGGVFSLDAASAMGTYAPGERKTLSVGYAPAARASDVGRVRLRTTAPDGAELLVELRGRGVGPVLEVCSVSGDGSEACTVRGEDPLVNLRDVDLGQRGTGALRVRNGGERDLEVEASVLGMGSPELSFSPEPSRLGTVTLMAGASSTIDVAYIPTDYVFDAVNVAFVSNDPDRRTQAVRVEGNVPKPNIEAIPRSMTFRLTGGGVSESFAPVKIINCGTRPLRFDAAPRLARNDGNAFELRNFPAAGAAVPTAPPGGCDQTAPGIEFDVIFRPSAVGTFEAEVEVRTNDPLDPVLTITAAGARS